MAGKRNSATRAPTETARRGRPRRATRSTYATTGNEDVEDGQLVLDQAPPAEEQPEPAAIRELQQLQAQLLSLQQERDRVAAAYAATQQAALASTQAAEIRQQLCILQAEIQSMQPTP